VRVLDVVVGIASGVGLVLVGGWAVRNPEFLREVSEKMWDPDGYTDWYVRLMPRMVQGFGVLVVLVPLTWLFR